MYSSPHHSLIPATGQTMQGGLLPLPAAKRRPQTQQLAATSSYPSLIAVVGLQCQWVSRLLCLHRYGYTGSTYHRPPSEPHSPPKTSSLAHRHCPSRKGKKPPSYLPSLTISHTSSTPISPSSASFKPRFRRPKSKSKSSSFLFSPNRQSPRPCALLVL